MEIWILFTEMKTAKTFDTPRDKYKSVKST